MPTAVFDVNTEYEMHGRDIVVARSRSIESYRIVLRSFHSFYAFSLSFGVRSFEKNECVVCVLALSLSLSHSLILHPFSSSHLQLENNLSARKTIYMVHQFDMKNMKKNLFELRTTKKWKWLQIVFLCHTRSLHGDDDGKSIFIRCRCW